MSQKFSIIDEILCGLLYEPRMFLWFVKSRCFQRSEKFQDFLQEVFLPFSR
jgi:hypothetical protein